MTHSTNSTTKATQREAGCVQRVLRILLDGARLRCPACREGRMSRGLFHVADACPRCGVAFEAGRGEFTGTVMFAMGFLGLVALFGYFALVVLLGKPHLVGVAWAVATGGVIPLFLYRNMKGLWIAALHAFDGLPGSRG